MGSKNSTGLLFINLNILQHFHVAFKSATKQLLYFARSQKMKNSQHFLKRKKVEIFILRFKVLKKG